jgi:hypothetical protein
MLISMTFDMFVACSDTVPSTPVPGKREGYSDLVARSRLRPNGGDAAGGLRRMSQIAFFTRDGDVRGPWPRISRPHHARKRADVGAHPGYSP